MYAIRSYYAFDPVFVRAMVEGRSIVEMKKESKVAGIVREMWKNIMDAPAMNMAGIRNFSAVIQ